ncbi:MAG: S-layer homology domain-containing protein, partial [Clostridia bacterium]|nr:S-layer homology domain-containing protein [Clostridia bacterium]
MRRIISVLLAITMLFSCGMVAMAEDAAATPAVGVEEIDFLAKLGIMDADADPEATITRAEMAKIVMMCIGQGEDLAPTDTQFTDVNASNEYSGYIQLAGSAGIMVGSGDGTFNPNGNVTYNQMVKLLTHAIGHEAFAQAAGGYPGGYLITA